jgi:hypothetical protein
MSKIETPRPYGEWHEDHGDVLWWLYPVKEAPWVGSPLDLGRTVSFDVTIQIGVDIYETEAKKVGNTGGWPWAEADEELLSRLFWTPLPNANEIDERMAEIIKKRG